MNPMRMRPSSFSAPGLDRRGFLKATAAAGAGLTLGFWTGGASAQEAGPGKTAGAAATGALEPNAFVSIGADNTVTVYREASRDGPGHLHRAPDARG